MKNFFLLLLIFSAALYAQERKPLNGKVLSDFDTTGGIYVINKATEVNTATNDDGYFTIAVAAKDTLVFSAVQFTEKKVMVAAADIDNGFLFVRMQPYRHQLDELRITDYSYINSYSLGLAEKGQKPPTPAERKLDTATSWKKNPMGLDPVFNLVSGRTAVLRNVVEIEKKISLMEKIDYLYTEEDIVSQFKIPQEYVKGFVFYAVENKYFMNAMNGKNKKMAEFLMQGLAGKYLELIADAK